LESTEVGATINVARRRGRGAAGALAGCTGAAVRVVRLPHEVDVLARVGVTVVVPDADDLGHHLAHEHLVPVAVGVDVDNRVTALGCH
jgi:hypothetical protein